MSLILKTTEAPWWANRLIEFTSTTSTGRLRKLAIKIIDVTYVKALAIKD